MDIQETDNTGCLCEGELRGWGTKSWEDRRPFAEDPFVPFEFCSIWMITYSKNQIIKKITKNTRLWKVPGVLSLCAQYKINQWPQNPSKYWEGNEKVRCFENITPFWWERHNHWDSCNLCVKMYKECLYSLLLQLCQAVWKGKTKMRKKLKMSKEQL